MEPRRTERVSQAVLEELSAIIGFELEDPRLGEVDVAEVIIEAGARHARVRVHVAGDERRCADALLALDGARRLLRREVAERLRLYRMPELHFEADLEAGPGVRVGKLLREARKGRLKSGPESKKSTLE
jgi:ribosome-binding factor A